MMLTPEQKSLHFETWEHIHQVRKLLTTIQIELLYRALNHDQSKIYSEEECGVFAEYTPKLKILEYGSQEYTQCLQNMGSAVRHHQISNRHHPEAHDGGIDGMNLLDILEMFCDWKAATLRTKDGDIRKSLEINRKRFNISDQLMNIFYNSISLVEDVNVKSDCDSNREQFTPKINSKSFYCSCGCNVFHKPDNNNELIYECNACGTWYEGC